jgi:hypothetical protein
MAEIAVFCLAYFAGVALFLYAVSQFCLAEKNILTIIPVFLFALAAMGYAADRVGDWNAAVPLYFPLVALLIGWVPVMRALKRLRHGGAVLLRVEYQPNVYLRLVGIIGLFLWALSVLTVTVLHFFSPAEIQVGDHMIMAGNMNLTFFGGLWVGGRILQVQVEPFAVLEKGLWLTAGAGEGIWSNPYQMSLVPWDEVVGYEWKKFGDSMDLSITVETWLGKEVRIVDVPHEMKQGFEALFVRFTPSASIVQG